MIQFIRTETESARTLMVAVAGRPMVLTGEHPNFDRIADLLAGLSSLPAADLPQVEADLLALVDFAQPAVDGLRQLSERITYRGGTLFFDGDPVDNRLSTHIVRMIRSGDDRWIGPVRFMENLSGNPAAHVRHRLYQWVSDRGMTITEDGLLIGYKGVNADPQNTSIAGGRNIVWVDDVPHTGHIPNPVGATVTMARAEVDGDRDAPCSQGLHVGTFDYAREWAGRSRRVLLVAFNPRDVVAIPKDRDYAKIRTCRYTVMRLADGQILDTTWPSDDEPADAHGADEYCQTDHAGCDGDGCDDVPDSVGAAARAPRMYLSRGTSSDSAGTNNHGRTGMGRPVCAVDIESTGLGWDRQAWEVALIRRDESGTTEAVFFVEVDLSGADPAALGIGGFYRRHPFGQQLVQGPTAFGPAGGVDSGPPPDGDQSLSRDDAARVIMRMTHEATIVGAQPQFDIHVFERMLRRAGLVPSWHYRLRDVESLTAGHLGRDVGGLAGCMEALGLEGDWPAHTALGDAQAALAVYDAVLTNPGLAEYAGQLRLEAEAAARGDGSGATWEGLMDEVGITAAELSAVPGESSDDQRP